VVSDHVRISLDRPARYTTFVLKEPPRLVVDFHETVVATSEREWEGYGVAVSRVRCGQFTSGPDPVARVVLDLDGEAFYSTEWDGGDMTVLLEPAGAASLRDAIRPVAPAEMPFPRTRNFDGRLLDAEGRPMNGTYLLRFSLKGWNESLYVRARNGRFSVLLGAVRPLPDTLFTLPVSAAAPAGMGWRVVSR